MIITSHCSLKRLSYWCKTEFVEFSLMNKHIISCLGKKIIFHLISLSFIFFNFLIQHALNVEAMNLDLTSAQDAVGRRFAAKFCESKEKGFSSELSSEFALNNTYLKFVAFPDDDKYVDNLWLFTIEKIKEECGASISLKEESELKDFFQEEGKIATNREFYLPN